ncbi:hypothetical protein CR513_45890, partial [Mucuna pruriens]
MDSTLSHLLSILKTGQKNQVTDKGIIYLEDRANSETAHHLFFGHQAQQENGDLPTKVGMVRNFSRSMGISLGTCTLVYLGMLPLSFGFNVLKTSSLSFWILDSGATDHMTPSSKYFSTYSPYSSNKRIVTTYDTLVTVSSIGNIKINSFITLKNVLLPKLSTNLDEDSGRTIGHVREGNDLYYLEELCLSIIENVHPSQSLMSESVSSKREKNFLFHFRLRHPYFETIKVMFPSLFFELNVENFQCDVCEISNHKCIPFPLSNKRSTFPFYLIHTDV